MGTVTNLINSKDPKGPFSSCFCFGYMHIMGDMDLKFIFRLVVILLWHFSYFKPRYNKIPNEDILQSYYIPRNHSSLPIGHLVCSNHLNWFRKRKVVRVDVQSTWSELHKSIQ